ncbi:hypothetical protein EUGRSUZ_F04236 [Eucalyptus grandis]|uniref:Uncharacterized protein n=2 Tax=Eucalyptus grandis TaxID=71139 RepID=A0ACC3KP33_EUCGR|nr:hypothetical protein EUGRSUZ_F04236 [Eucalyptus grandis]
MVHVPTEFNPVFAMQCTDERAKRKSIEQERPNYTDAQTPKFTQNTCKTCHIPSSKTLLDHEQNSKRSTEPSKVLHLCYIHIYFFTKVRPSRLLPLLRTVRAPDVIEPLGAAPHNPMEDLSYLLLQWIQAILHSLKHLRQVLHSLPHLLFLLGRQWELGRIHQFAHYPRAPLDLMDLPQQSARVPPLPLLRFLHDPLVERLDRRGPGELPRDGEMHLQPAVLAGDRRHEGPRHEEEDRVHREDRHGEAIGGHDLVPPRGRQVGPDRLNLPGGGPRPGDAPGERPEMAQRAVVPGHAAAAEGPLLPLPNLLDPVPDRITDVQGLDAPLVKIGNRPVHGGLRQLGLVIEHDHPELLLAAQERVEQLPNPREREQLLRAGRRQIKKPVGDLLLEGLHLQLGARRLVGRVHGMDGLVAPKAQDRPANVRALVLRRRHLS